jgi:hypothetical protein
MAIIASAIEDEYLPTLDLLLVFCILFIVLLCM